MQNEPSEAGWSGVERERAASRLKLNAGGWRAEKAAIALRVREILMDVSPENAAHLRMSVDDRHQLGSVVEANPVQPSAFDRDRVVMQRDQRGTLVFR